MYYDDVYLDFIDYISLLTWDPSLLFLLTVIISSYLSAPSGVTDFFASIVCFPWVAFDDDDEDCDEIICCWCIVGSCA